MRVIIALGGNSLLRRGEPFTMEAQRRNVELAATAIAEVISAGHEVIVTHGNGPQVGLMALQDAAYDVRSASPLDVLCAESQGMIGYLITRALRKTVGAGRQVVALLTQVEVDPADPAFQSPSKPIGPFYDKKESEALARSHGWHMITDGDHFRRAVPSPRPLRIVEIEAIRRLVDEGVTLVCAGGGGIPVARNAIGRLKGIEAIIDKDHTSALLAREVEALALLILTDVDGIYLDWGTSRQRLIQRTRPSELRRHEFLAGSMAPKVAAAISFVENGGSFSAVGRLENALRILEGGAGTRIGC